jgi:hypothetical protein
MSSEETARAMVEHYIKLGGAKIEQEPVARGGRRNPKGSGRCGRFPSAVIWRHCQPRFARYFFY